MGISSGPEITLFNQFKKQGSALDLVNMMLHLWMDGEVQQTV